MPGEKMTPLLPYRNPFPSPLSGSTAPTKSISPWLSLHFVNEPRSYKAGPRYSFC